MNRLKHKNKQYSCKVDLDSNSGLGRFFLIFKLLQGNSAVPNENVVSRIRYRGESRAILCLFTYISHSHTMPRLPAEIPEHRN